jgi:ferritin-like metal-binding protein YciE
MFEHFDTLQEAYGYRLGAALAMEQKIVDLLGESAEAAQSEEVSSALLRHQQETQGHAEVLEQVFGCFEWEVDTAPCPAVDGLHAEAKAMIKKTDDRLVDAIILQGCVEVEHHEIAVYENLVVHARAMGREDVVDLLERNLKNEEQTLRLVLSAQKRVVAKTPQRSARR